MRRFAVGVLAASFAAIVLPHAAAAQCEGGVTVTGLYTRDGSYMPAHCAYTNPTTPGQLYPSGAQPVPSTNPAQGASRLPGQLYPSGLLPVNSSDLGPAPSYVNMPGLQGQGVTDLGPRVGPGAPAAADANGVIAPGTGAAPGNVVPSQVAAAAAVTGVAPGTTDTSLLPGQPMVSTATASTGQPDQSPQTGLPALNINRAVPSSLMNGGTATATGALMGTGVANGVIGAVNPATGTLMPATGAVAAPGTAAPGANLNQVNTAYGVSTLPSAPARAEQTYTSEQLNTVTVAFPGQ